MFFTKEKLLRDIGFYVHWEGIINEISFHTPIELQKL
jgi:hypothetical protein